MQTQKGFTIIELIVVIAIIVVLAAIVLVNVTQYINKGKDAAIKGNLATLMTNGATYYDNYKTYYDLAANPVIDFCADNFTAGKPIFDSDPSDGKTCNDSDTEWAACSQLFTTSEDYWCVDSAGTKKQVTGTCTDFTGTVCP